MKFSASHQVVGLALKNTLHCLAKKMKARRHVAERTGEVRDMCNYKDWEECEEWDTSTQKK